MAVTKSKGASPASNVSKVVSPVSNVSKSAQSLDALRIVYDFFEMYQECFNEGHVPSEAELSKYFASNFTLTSNGVVKSRNIRDYISRYKLFQEEYSKFKFSKPLVEPIISGNRAAIYYNIDLVTQDGGKVLIRIIALANFEGGKIASWTQVAHEQGSGGWDE